MAKKDKKSKSAEQKARVAAKQSKKAARTEKKTKSKNAADSHDEEEDLQSVLEKYAREQEQFLKVEEKPCEPPSSRSSSTLIGSPSNAKELLLFGGEYYDGALATFFNDLFVYHIERDEWRQVTSPNSPLPRSGHAMCRGGGGHVYLFGGEFSSQKQGKFYHYSDFWRLDPSSREWTRLEGKGKSPPARSGHRMTYYKNFIILFGGFQDTSQQTKYLQDLWLYDCQRYVWYNPTLPPATQKPDPRSSFSFLPHDSGAVMYGGYSRVKAVSSAGNKTKGGNQTTKVSMKPVVHQDSWLLRVVILPQGETSSTSPNIRWERRKKPVNAPNPARAGATQAFHKGRGILFGGVHDVEESEEGIDSEFFNQLFAWNIDRNRFFPLALRRPRAASKKTVEIRENRNKGQADEAELLRNLAALEAKGTIRDADEMDLDFVEKDIEPPSSALKPVSNTMPHPRFNAQITVQNDTLYIFGGTFEKGDRFEYTFADMYAVDLSKMDGVTEIYKREIDNWQEDQDGSQSESDEDDDSDSEDEEEDELSSVTLISPNTSTAVSATPVFNEGKMDETEEDGSGSTEPVLTDMRPHPRPFEALRDFFIRTSNDWQDLLLKNHQYSTEPSNQSVKEIKKAAFEIAETKWWDSREEVTAEEERQEEAGIGEVISMGDRSNEGGPNRRR